MRRYTILLITSFVIMLGVITGTMYISGTGSHKENNSLLGEITVYTTLPTEMSAIWQRPMNKIIMSR